MYILALIEDIRKTSGIDIVRKQISCSIPSDFERYPVSNLTAIILLGNLFEADNENALPQWISPLFKSASNLYLNASRIMEGKIVFILGVIVGIYALWFLFRKKFIAKGKTKQCEDDMSVNAFLENLIAIRQYFGDWTMIFTVIGLLILYSQTSNYYDCNGWLTTFSLCFYESDELWVNYILLIAIIIFNIVICRTIWRLLKAQYAIRNLVTKAAIEINAIQNPSKTQIYMIDSWSNTERTYSKAMINCYNMFKIISYTIMYLLGLAIIVFYIIIQELPDDNILGLGSTERRTINYSVSVLLAFNSAIIVPHLVNAYARYFVFCVKHRNEIIMILRSIKVVIVPILASFVLLNACGKGWRYFGNHAGFLMMNQYLILLQRLN